MRGLRQEDDMKVGGGGALRGRGCKWNENGGRDEKSRENQVRMGGMNNQGRMAGMNNQAL